jgi:hypothetical protein
MPLRGAMQSLSRSGAGLPAQGNRRRGCTADAWPPAQFGPNLWLHAKLLNSSIAPLLSAPLVATQYDR